MIDSFDSPDPYELLFCPGEAPWGDGNPCAMENVVAGVVGGERDVFVETRGEPRAISAIGMVGYEPSYEAGILALATYGFGDLGSASYVILQYDGVDDDEAETIWPALTNSEQLNTDLTGDGTNTAFVFGFLGLDAGSNRDSLDLNIVVNGPEGSAAYSGAIPESPLAFNHTVDFADFTVAGANPFNAATSVTITLNNPTTPSKNIDFELDSISAIPEPSTLGLLALGCLGCLVGVTARRWRRR
ncbi:MAG: PEP-CTERM sorting domain-containing protein [Candidatus Nealsonbacteria bacterium]|nr:PEP-CTERM sorting domain-containing protein [Candidatus Nealsonbacteria bacterium]